MPFSWAVVRLVGELVVVATAVVTASRAKGRNASLASEPSDFGPREERAKSMQPWVSAISAAMPRLDPSGRVMAAQPFLGTMVAVPVASKLYSRLPAGWLTLYLALIALRTNWVVSDPTPTMSVFAGTVPRGGSASAVPAVPAVAATSAVAATVRLAARWRAFCMTDPFGGGRRRRPRSARIRPEHPERAAVSV